MDGGSDDLDVWINTLRDQTARGELDHLGSINLGGLKLDGERAILVMLADLDHLDSLPPELAEDPLTPIRRLELLADFRRLRDQIG